MKGDMKMMKGGMMQGGMKMAQTADLSDVKYDAFLLNGKSNTDPWACQARAGERVRFRLINGSASTFFRFMIDGHGPHHHAHRRRGRCNQSRWTNLLLGSGECYDLSCRSGRRAPTHPRRGARRIGRGVGVLHTRDAKPMVNHRPPVWGKRTLDYAHLRALHPTRLPPGRSAASHSRSAATWPDMSWTINDQVYPKADPLVIRKGERIIVESQEQPIMFTDASARSLYRLLARPGEDSFAPLSTRRGSRRARRFSSSSLPTTPASGSSTVITCTTWWRGWRANGITPSEGRVYSFSTSNANSAKTDAGRAAWRNKRRRCFSAPPHGSKAMATFGRVAMTRGIHLVRTGARTRASSQRSHSFERR